MFSASRIGFLCLLMYCFPAFFTPATAQVKSISGIVLSDTVRISGAHIIDLKTGVRTSSDLRGQFTIKASKSDTLITNLFSYKTDTLVISGKDIFVIRLRRASNILREVTIKNTALSPLQQYNQNRAEYKDIYWKGDKSNMIGISVGMISGINLNIDKLYNALSKQGKDARRMQRTLTRDYEEAIVNHRFNKSFVGRITGYKGKQLDDFIFNHRPTFDFVSKATEYELIAYIKKEAVTTE